MVEKLVVVVMGQDGERFLNMSLPAIRDADAVVLCDGGSTDKTREIFDRFAKEQPGKFRWIENKYDQEDKAMNGKQRNFYLNYLKDNYPNDWALILDADEVVENLMYIKEYIQTAQSGLYSIQMRHFHLDLGHEDATQEKHWVLNRLFKISEAFRYPETEHPVLQPKYLEVWNADTQSLEPSINHALVGQTDCTTIWHLAHLTHCFSIKKRYEKNLSHSNMHSKEFLDAWNKAHILGGYPNKPVDPKDIPAVILQYFHINIDEIYFANRQVELKHALMVRQWFEHFQPQSVLDLGCGRGPYMYFWQWMVPGKVTGYEISKWAIDHAFPSGIEQKDISEDWNLEFPTGKQGKELVQLPAVDLVCAVDVLEHLSNEQLNRTLKNMYKYGNKFLFSIPFIGDPNLTNDKTHLQHRTKEGWIKLLEGHGFKISDPPAHWLFKEQILIGTK